MALNLVARLSLDGNQFTTQMRRIQRQVQTANRSMQSMNTVNTQLSSALRGSSSSARTFTASQTQLRNAVQRSQTATTQLSSSQSVLHRNTQQLNRTVNSTSGGFNLVGRTAGSAIRGISGMTTAVLGLAGAYMGIQGAKKLFDSTIGEAAKYEQSKVVIEAMFQDDKKAEKYMKAMNKLAIDSPLLNSQDIFANSKSFISFTQDLPMLERMFKLVERLNASDPMQGVEGAVFSLKELFSGDALSIQRRFEIGTKSEWNAIKKLSVDKQVAAVEKLLDKYRITEDMIAKMGDTTLGVWNQIKEGTEIILRDMGAPALAKIRDFIGIINDQLQSGKLDRFKQTGAKILENVTTGFIDASKGVGRWIESIQKNEEFQKQTTLFGQVKWVIGDVYENFTKWLDGGGRDKIAQTSSDVIQVLTASLEASISHVLPIGIKIGSAIASGVSDGFKKQYDESGLSQFLKDPVGFAIKKATFGYVDPIKDSQRLEEKIFMGGAQGPLKYDDKLKFSPNPQKKNGGLSRVPFDGAVYSLHKDEMILPRGQADAYRNGNNNGGVVVNVAKMEVRQESDIQKVAYELVRMIESEGMLMGY